MEFDGYSFKLNSQEMEDSELPSEFSVSEAPALSDDLRSRAHVVRQEAMNLWSSPFNANKGRGPELFDLSSRMNRIATEISRSLEIKSGLSQIEEYLEDK